jgi:enoyl-CoA hydratase/carnithine racemase
VFGAYDSLGLDCYSVLADVWPAQVIQKTRACERVVRGAAVRVVLVTNNEESHFAFAFDLSRFAEHQAEQAEAPASPLSATE